VSESFSISIELQGIDDASDEIKAVQESLKGMGEALAEAGEASEMTVERAKEVLKAARDEQRVLKATAEEAQIFSNRAIFMANQLNTVAGFGAKLNSIYNSINTAMTRLNTAQIAYNDALEKQRILLAMVNAEYGVQASTVDEAIELLDELKGYYVEAGASTKELDEAIKQLTQSKKEVAKATQEVTNAQQMWQQQLVALSLQAVGLIPQFMNMVNSLSTLGALLPGIGNALGTVKTAFMGLYAAMGPVGLILMTLAIIIPLLIAYWDQIAGALKAAGDAIWSVLEPALNWLWKNILEPLANFIISQFKPYIDALILVWYGLQAAAEKVGGALQWVWDNILRPLAEFIIGKFVKDIKDWVGVFEWARDKIIGIFNAIKNAIEGALNWIIDKINWVKDQILGGFDWLYHQLVGGSIIPDMWSSIVDWTRWGINEMSGLMSGVGLEMSPTVRGPVALTVNVNIGGTAASAEEIAEAVSREILRRLRGMGV
jgi:ABC-type transporter Mla subunit MlaD